MGIDQSDNYTFQEKEEMRVEYIRLLRVKDISEHEFRIAMKKIGVSPQEVDHEIDKVKGND